MASYVWLLLIATSIPAVCANSEFAREGFMDHLSNGVKFAKDFLGSESIALKVAEFVVRAFNVKQPPPIRRRPNDAYVDDTSEDTYRPSDTSKDTYRPDDSSKDIYRPDDSSKDTYGRPDYSVNEEYNPMTPLKHLVKLFGLQPSQLSAVAVNALVFVAQMISTFLAGPRRPNRAYHEDPTTWILNKQSKTLQHLILTAKNESLPEAIEDMIKEQGSEEETSCIRLLVCKITPYIIRMQKAVFGNETQDNGGEVRGSASLYRHLPSKDEIEGRSEVCEKMHRDCDLNE